MATKETLDTLKTTILKRRELNGQEAIHVDFTTKRPMPMTKAEIEKDERRKRINRQSAKKSRLIEKQQLEDNNRMLEEESLKKRALFKQIEELELGNTRLYDQLKSHVPEFEIKKALASTSRDPENKLLSSGDSVDKHGEFSKIGPEIFYTAKKITENIPNNVMETANKNENPDIEPVPKPVIKTKESGADETSVDLSCFEIDNIYLENDDGNIDFEKYLEYDLNIFV